VKDANPMSTSDVIKLNIEIARGNWKALEDLMKDARKTVLADRDSGPKPDKGSVEADKGAKRG
jgi:hypothetical protein